MKETVVAGPKGVCARMSVGYSVFMSIRYDSILGGASGRIGWAKR